MHFLAPTRAGDTTTVRVEVLEVKPTRSKTDGGMMLLLHRGFNPYGDKVIGFIELMLGCRRPEVA